MIDDPRRRRFLQLATAASIMLPVTARARADRLERQRGDPDLPPESIQIQDDVIRSLLGPSRASFLPRPANFAALLIAEAASWLGSNRLDNGAQITRLLQLFHLPFSDANGPVPFCAAGVSFVAASCYARLAAPSAAELTLGTLTSYLGEVEHYHFYPSPSVRDIVLVAQGHHRWVARGGAAKVKPGSLIVFDWEKNGGADHIGIVEAIHGDRVDTIEFNTSAAARPGSTAANRQGGAVARKQRSLGAGTVKGFISI